MPHDFQMEMPWSKESHRNRGFKPMGAAWYRNEFVTDAAWGDERVFLDFEGVMCIGDVWVNGRKVASTEYGYLGFEVDVTKFLNPIGKVNKVEVWASTGHMYGSRWYTGGGLYRPVRIKTRPARSIARHGIFVTTPEVSPDPIKTPEAKPTPEVTSPTPGLTDTPGPEPTEEPGLTPDVPVTSTPLPEPTASPEYDTLMENGWQRTDDFFGYREIYFSGMFDNTELIAVPGRYEYRYTSTSDRNATFSMIGEEGVSVDAFLEELALTYPDCVIGWESIGDYSYEYTAGDYRVKGRIYDCGTGDSASRIRVEFYSPVGEEQKEGYVFYLN